MEEKRQRGGLVMALLVILSIGGAFMIGRLTTQVEYLSKANTNTLGTQEQQAAPQQQQAASVSLEDVKALVNDNKNLVFGNKDAKVLFVEFSDPSCPYCHIAAGKNPKLNSEVGAQFKMVADGGSYVPPVPEMKKLVDQGKAAFVWLYANGHGNGEMATKALYCANEKGKFWEAHDLIMTAEGYDVLNNAVKNDAAKAGELATFLKGAVNAPELQKCLESGKYDNRIADDQALAVKMNFRGTPYFLMNTTPFVGAYSFKDMESAVNAAL